jgi:hypothetical protein
LEKANVAPVDIKVDPETAGTKITVSSFAPDETFEPRTIHLAPGHHVIIATAPGFAETRFELDVPDKTPQHVVIKLAKPGEKIDTHPPLPPPTEPGYTLDQKLIKAGLVVAVGGVAAYGVMGFAWFKLNNIHNSGTKTEFDNSSFNKVYDYSRFAAIGLWVAGAGLVGTGLYLRSNQSSRAHTHEDAPMVSAAPLPEGGGIVTVGWQR